MKTRTPYGKSKVITAHSKTPSAGNIFVVPGFSETTAHNSELVDALANEGFDATTFSQPRRTGRKADRIADPIGRQGRVILRVLEASVTPGEKVHAVAHSMGAAATLKAALEAPELFDSLTLMQPLGLAGEQGFSELLGRVNKKTVKNQRVALHSQDPRKLADHGYAANLDTESALNFSGRVTNAHIAAGKVLLSQPALSLREARAAGTYSMTDDIAKVTALGIPVHLVVAHGDEMFDHDKVDAGYDAGVAASSYMSVADREAGHDTFWMQPARTAAIVGQIIRHS